MSSKNQLTQLEFLKYLNYARQYPAYFVSIIERQISEFIENDMQLPLSPDVYYETNQGKQAWIEAKNFLMQQKSLPPLVFHEGLAKSAQAHTQDICQNGIFGHIGSDGSTFNQRILKYCKKGPGAMSEMIGSDFMFEGRNTAEMTVLSLIIDDGIKERGHRKTIFSEVYRYIGWYSGIQEQKIFTVFNLTENHLHVLQSDECSTSISDIAPSESLIHLQKPKSKELKSKQQISAKQVQTTFKDISNTPSNQTPISTLHSSCSNSKWNMPQTETSSFWKPKNSAIQERMQNSRVYYEDGCKIVETTTKCYYEDGRIEQNTEKRIIYKPELAATK